MEDKLRDVSSGNGGGQDRPDIDLAKPHDHHMIPVWFFVGIILLIYGVIIFCTGISERSSPPLEALKSMPHWVQHPAIWWGALLTVIGGIYVYAYMPRKS
jgi:hypothetical protein